MALHRKLTRKELVYNLEAIDIHSGQLLGHVVDITTEGVKLISKTPLALHTDYQFQIVFAKGFEDEKIIDVEAEAVWANKDINPDYYATGLKFANISSEGRKKIDELIVTYAFHG